MKKRSFNDKLNTRFQECLDKLLEEVNDIDSVNSSMVILSGKRQGRAFQVFLTIDFEEDNFVGKGFGEIELGES